MRRIRDALLRVLDALIPPHPDAVRARSVTADELRAHLRPLTLPGAPWIHALWPYHAEPVRAVIKAVKFYGERALAERMGLLAAEYCIDFLADQRALGGWDDLLIAPIPSAPARARARGYNQAALFASVIAREAGVAYDADLLTREERPSQVRLARSARAKNIAGACLVPRAERASGRTVLLIDDVVESGATLNDARRALKEAGAKRVVAIAMAH